MNTVARREKSAFNSTESVITTLRGCIWARYSHRKRISIVREVFRYWRARGFPNYELTQRELQLEFERLMQKDSAAVFCGSDLRASNVGLRLANAFQPEMWKAKVNRYKSPLEVFNDDELLRCAIERSLRIWPDRFGANASCLRRILKSYPGAASVSNYRPMIAKAVITKFSGPGGLVVDFAAGYGGRLLGSLAADRAYFGIEPNRAQVSGFMQMMRSLSRAGFRLPHVRILHGRAEQQLSKVPTQSAELVFSSPPFFNWEHYSYSNTQSFRRYPRYEVWKQRFLLSVIGHSFRVLKPKGKLVLNVSNGNRLPSSTDVRQAASVAGFRYVTSYRMLFPKLPYLHPRDGEALKSELLLVFRK